MGRSRRPPRINLQPLVSCAKALVDNNKGLLAIDESNPTCNRRFAALGIPETVEMRRAWRELLVTAPDLGDSISGAILYDETKRQLAAALKRKRSPAMDARPATSAGSQSRQTHSLSF